MSLATKAPRVLRTLRALRAFVFAERTGVAEIPEGTILLAVEPTSPRDVADLAHEHRLGREVQLVLWDGATRILPAGDLAVERKHVDVADIERAAGVVPEVAALGRALRGVIGTPRRPSCRPSFTKKPKTKKAG